MALSDPRSRLRGHNGSPLRAREPCLRCDALISAYAPASDRFCIVCAPLVEDEPARALLCPQGHPRLEFEVVIVDRSRASGLKRTCSECKRLRDAARDRSTSAIEARRLERRRAA